MFTARSRTGEWQRVGRPGFDGVRLLELAVTPDAIVEDALVPDLEPDDVPEEWKARKKLWRRERRPLLFARGQRDFTAWLETVKLAAL